MDVGFPGFVRDPLAAIAGLYDAAGLPLTAEAERSMAGWIAAHPRRDLQYDGI